jgi:hypothetical protein
MNELLSKYYAYKLIYLLTQPWTSFDAYKLGLIDDKGVLIRKPDTSEEKSAYTAFYRLAFNLKRTLQKMPLGQWRLSSYASALYLLKNSYNLDGQLIESILINDLKLKYLIIEDVDVKLVQGTYNLVRDLSLNPSRYKSGDKVTMRTPEKIDSYFGQNLYKGIHNRTNDTIVFCPTDVVAMEDGTAAVNTAGGNNIAGLDQPLIKAPLKRKKPDGEFAGSPVFDVDNETYKRCTHGKPTYARWKHYVDDVDVEENLLDSIRTHAHRNPSKSIVLRNKSTGAMLFLRRK